jgi:Mg-chelatase subunit ChlD
MSTFTCNLCGVTCTSSAQLEQHCAGVKHQRRAGSSMSTFTCNLCGVTCTSSAQLAQHCAGVKHQRRAGAAAVARSGGGGRPSTALARHARGESHAAVRQRTRAVETTRVVETRLERTRVVETTVCEHRQQPSAALTLVVAIDVSSSMRGRRLEEALEGCRTLLRAVRERHHEHDVVKLLTFSHQHTTVQGFIAVRHLSDEKLERVLRGVEARGGTAIFDTLQHMRDDLDAAKASVGGRATEFVLLTDGVDQHSERGGSSEESCRWAKRRLASPGCPHFSTTVLFVGDDGAGRRSMAEFAEGVDHIRVRPVEDSRRAIRAGFRQVVVEVMRRVEIVETLAVRGGGASRR